MTIPSDSHNRWWVEASEQNPDFVDSFRPALVAFVSFGRDGEPYLNGCGFIIAGDNQNAVAITAKHILTEGVARSQNPLPRHAPSAIFIRPSSVRLSIDPESLKVFRTGQNTAEMLNVAYVEYNETLDIACVVTTPQNTDAALSQPIAVPIDTAVPSVGDVVQILSLDRLNVSEISNPTEGPDVGRVIRINKRNSLRVGVVTGIYPAGYRQYRWPCFTTSIPAEPGMSGSPVVLQTGGNTISVCGIICADNSSAESRSDNYLCGESVIACAWPALALHVPETLPPISDMQQPTLYDLMKSGRMPTAVGGIDHIDMTELENGDLRIGLR